MSISKVLKSGKEPLFGGTVIATYAATMLCFKLGLFFAAAGLALLSSPNKIHKNESRGLKLGDAANLFQELTN